MAVSEAPALIGVDLGGTHVRAGLVRGKRVIDARRSEVNLWRACRADDPAATATQLVDTLADIVMETRAGHDDVVAIGLAVPGFLDAAHRVLMQSPNIPGVQKLALADALQARLGVPVLLANDALAAAWGEKVMLPEPVDNLIYLGLGTGVGGGLVLDGEPVYGQHGMAMEVGHITVAPGGRECGCGNRGCLERYASASGVGISYQQATGESLSAQQIAALARSGDAQALAAFDLAGTTLGQAVATLVKVLDVTRLVIGGGMSAAWPLLAAALQRQLETDLVAVQRQRLTLSPSTCADQCGIIGAAHLARRNYLQQ